MGKAAICLALALGGCASLVLEATSAAAASDEQDQPVRTMRNSLPTTAATPDDAEAPREGADSAFSRNRNVSVLERPHPEYAPMGVRVGGFMLYPKLTEATSYDDNVFASSTNAISDWIFVTKPQARIESNWSRNSLGAFASVTAYNYVQLSRLNSVDFEVGVDGRYDVAGASYIFGGAQEGRYTVPFTNLSVPRDSAVPEQYDLSQGDVGAVQELNRIRFSERFDVSDFRYRNLVDGLGDLIIEDDQNHVAYLVQSKAEYAVSPATALFGEASWNQRDYQTGGGVQGVSSDGFEVTVGASFDISHLVRGEARIGYLKQDYASAPLAHPPIPSTQVSGPAFHGKIEWFPSGLTTVTLTGARQVEDWTIVGASGTLGTGGSIQVDHELLRNVIVTANGAYNQFDYIGVSRVDKVFIAGFGGNYLMNRRVSVNAGYRYMTQTSSAPSLNFAENRLSIGLALQY